MEFITARAEIDIMVRLHQMPASPKELRETTPYTTNQIHRLLASLKAVGLIRRVPGTHLMTVVEI